MTACTRCQSFAYDKYIHAHNFFALQLTNQIDIDLENEISAKLKYKSEIQFNDSVSNGNKKSRKKMLQNKTDSSEKKNMTKFELVYGWVRFKTYINTRMHEYR